MGKLKVTDFYLYRWRHVLGFLAIAIALLALLFVVGRYVPGGISEAEMKSVVMSDHTPPNVLLGEHTSYVLHMPYHVLQKISIQLLGVSSFSIKLPSLIMALASVMLLYGLLRLWFRRNVAIIASAVVVSTGQFLLSSQSGTPEIGYLFWSTALLFCTSMLAQAGRFRWIWLIIVSLVAGFALYTPLEIYVVISLAITCLIHPHARFIVFRQPAWVLALSAVLFGFAIAPLVAHTIGEPAIVSQLFGIPSDLSIISWDHARNLLGQYIGFLQPVHNGASISPAFGLPVVLLALLGLYRLFTAKYTAKSYIITIWALFLIPVVILQHSAVNFTFLPIILLVAFAINYLISSWYKLFPLNPYARVAGLLPLGVFVLSLTFSNVERFMYGYHYDRAARQDFSYDLRLVDTASSSLGNKVVLVVPSEQKDFYTTYASRLPREQELLVNDSLGAARAHQGAPIVAHASQKAAGEPSAIIVASTSQDAARWYVYKNQAK